MAEEKLQCFTIEHITKFTWESLAFLLGESQSMGNGSLITPFGTLLIDVS